MSSAASTAVSVHSPDDAEKGLVDDHKLSSLPVSTLSLTKKEEIVTVNILPRAPVVTASQPRAKAQPTVSKHTLFALWFNTYRKFFVFTFSLNIIGIALAASGHWPYAVKYTSALILGNIHISVLVRNELFGRFLYLAVNTLFAKWTPLWFRLGCTSVLQHLGGIHSGCALSGLCWLLYKVIINFRHKASIHDSVLAMGVVTNVAIALTAMAAIPWVRNTHHNVFERHHRFIGWTALLCTWAFTILTDLWDHNHEHWNLSGVHVVKQQDFWFVLLMTFFIAWPWMCTRKVSVEIEIPSQKVAVVRFKRGMQQGLLGRISRTAVMEYHAFGIISEGPKAEYHYMICGVQGDFTKKLVADQPSHVWTRELKFAGVSNTSTLYKRGIRVCTGTGIGAALSTCIQNPNWYLIWIGSDQAKTFGPTITALIHNNIGDERLCLWDSKARGKRPDMMQLVKDTYHSWGAEVVFITSNMGGNDELMRGCREADIPAFGTLWDF